MMQTRFKSMFGMLHLVFVVVTQRILTLSLSLAAGLSKLRGNQPMYTIMNGSPKDLERLLQLRENCADK
jgi:hypothetical protein